MAPRLIVGLGNPGARYAATRHNVGAVVLARLVKQLGAAGSRVAGAGSTVYKVRVSGGNLFLGRPLSYMNDSGAAVGKMARTLEVSANEILVVCDCLDVALGRLRFRMQGGSGGHRGVESIIRELGGEDFPRLRIGVGRPAPGATATEYVLAEWTPAEQPVIEQVADTAVAAVLLAVRRGMRVAMDEYNGWICPDPSPAANTAGD